MLLSFMESSHFFQPTVTILHSRLLSFTPQEDNGEESEDLINTVVDKFEGRGYLSLSSELKANPTILSSRVILRKSGT